MQQDISDPQDEKDLRVIQKNVGFGLGIYFLGGALYNAWVGVTEYEMLWSNIWFDPHVLPLFISVGISLATAMRMKLRSLQPFFLAAHGAIALLTDLDLSTNALFLTLSLILFNSYGYLERRKVFKIAIFTSVFVVVTIVAILIQKMVFVAALNIVIPISGFLYIIYVIFKRRLRIHSRPTLSFKEHGLSDLEKGTVLSILANLEIPQIAMAQGCAESTVYNRLKSIYEKFGVSNWKQFERLLGRFELID